MKNELPTNVKDALRESALEIAEILLLEDQEFRIVIWNNDNWNNPLPQRIMEAFPTQLVLDIKEQSLEDSYVDENTGEIVICTVFDGVEYMKILEIGELIAVLSLDGQPYILNDFPQEDNVIHEIVKEIRDNTAYIFPTSFDEMVEMLTSDGIPEEGAKRSLEMFMKNNPQLAEKIK